MFGSSDRADSAGQPWEGREFEENPYAHDDGSAPQAFLAAIAALRASEPHTSERVSAHVCVIDALRQSRLLIPLLAEAGDIGVSPAGLVVDKTQELAIVTVAGPQGQKVLPVFTSVESMQTWNPQSRPVPVEARKAALAAVADGALWMVVDPVSKTEIVLKRPEVEAIAKDQQWIPAYADEELQRIFQASISEVEHVEAVRLLVGDAELQGLNEDLIIQLSLTPGLGKEEVGSLLEQLSLLWSQQDAIAAKVDSMKIQLVSAS